MISVLIRRGNLDMERERETRAIQAEEGPCGDIARRQPSASQDERPACLDLGLLTAINMRKQVSVVHVIQCVVFGYSSPVIEQDPVGPSWGQTPLPCPPTLTYQKALVS